MVQAKPADRNPRLDRRGYCSAADHLLSPQVYQTVLLRTEQVENRSPAGYGSDPVQRARTAHPELDEPAEQRQQHWRGRPARLFATAHATTDVQLGPAPARRQPRVPQGPHSWETVRRHRTRAVLQPLRAHGEGEGTAAPAPRRAPSRWPESLVPRPRHTRAVVPPPARRPPAVCLGRARSRRRRQCCTPAWLNAGCYWPWPTTVKLGR